MRAGLSDRETTVASRPARACSSRDMARPRSLRRGQLGPATTWTGVSAMEIDASSTSSRITPSVGSGTVATAGRKPSLTTRTRRTPLPNRMTRNWPRSFVIVRAAMLAVLSSSVTTADGMGSRLALSRTTPRSSCPGTRPGRSNAARAITTKTRRIGCRFTAVRQSRFAVPRSPFPLFPIPDPAADVDGFEALLTPVHDEDAEPLAHAHLDVIRRRRIPARDTELLARREHLLDRGLPPLFVERALSVRVGGREDAAQRPRAREQHADPLHGRDLPDARESGLALDDREVDELTLRVERPEVGLFPVLLLAHSPVSRRAADVVGPRAAFRLEAHCREPGLHLVGTLDADEHHTTDAEAELVGNVPRGFRGIGGDLVHLHDERMMKMRAAAPVDHPATRVGN